MAPTNDESIINLLWSLPAIVLHTWGIKRPINPIAPVIATNADVSNVDKINITDFTNLTLFP